MKHLIIFEDAPDEPVSVVVSAVCEVLARPPAFDAKVVLCSSVASKDPIERVLNATKDAFATLNANPTAERGAFFLPTVIRGADKAPVFTGKFVLYMAQAGIYKLSMFENSGTTSKPVLNLLVTEIMKRLVKEFPVLVMTDYDRELSNKLFVRVTQGMNLAVSRLSTSSGKA